MLISVDPAMIGNLRLLMELGSDAMPHQFADHAEPGGLSERLDGVADIADMISHRGRGDAHRQALPGNGEQSLRRRRDLSDRRGSRSVGVKPLPLHPHIDTDDAPLHQQAPGAGDTVDDSLVNRYADDIGEAFVAQHHRLHIILLNLLGGISRQLFGHSAGPDFAG